MIYINTNALVQLVHSVLRQRYTAGGAGTAGRADTRRLMDTFSEEAVVGYLNDLKEAAYARCDAATRRTRRLVKMVTVIDMAHARLGETDRRFLRCLGRSSSLGERHYPQLIALTVPINVPPLVGFLWQLGRRLLPEHMLARLRFCAAHDSARQSVAECPFAARYFTPETLCTFLGGRLPPPPRLRVADDETEPYRPAAPPTPPSREVLPFTS